jgi:hypothetical protein
MSKECGTIRFGFDSPLDGTSGTGVIDKRNIGMVEWWNIGSKKIRCLKDPLFHSSTIPSFPCHVVQYYTAPKQLTGSRDHAF